MTLSSTAIITAAGLSSRMGDCKPFLPLNGFLMIQMTVQSALDGGVEQVVVVSGRQADDLRLALEDIELHDRQRLDIVHNPDFAKTDMLHSIKLGLREAKTDAAFILPGDMPVVSPKSFGALRKRLENTGEKLVFPCYQSRHGHPLLLRRETFGAVLDFEGEGGLRAAIDHFDLAFMDIDDPGLLLDADTTADFAALEVYARETKGIAATLVTDLLDRFETPAHIRAHCQATGVIASRMARNLNVHGFCLDSELVRSAAALHDMVRLEDRHWKAAARELSNLGYKRLSEVVGDHHEPLEDAPAPFTESSIVFAADKIVQETTLVTLDERYAQAVAKFPASTKVGAMIYRDREICRELLERYERITGDSLDLAQQQRSQKECSMKSVM